MDLKLQQALLAARTGHSETAQVLLSELIQDNPGEANAWFLLSYLVDTSERQARYLQQVLMLDPSHAFAQEHLQRLMEPGVPAPVIQSKQKRLQVNGAGGQTAVAPQPQINSPATPVQPEIATPATGQLPEWLQDLDNKRLGTTKGSPADQEWARSAGTPKREPQVAAKTTVRPAVQSSAQTSPATTGTTGLQGESSDVGTNQKMLLGILLALVIMSMMVLGFLLLQIFF